MEQNNNSSQDYQLEPVLKHSQSNSDTGGSLTQRQLLPHHQIPLPPTSALSPSSRNYDKSSRGNNSGLSDPSVTPGQTNKYPLSSSSHRDERGRMSQVQSEFSSFKYQPAQYQDQEKLLQKKNLPLYGSVAGRPTKREKLLAELCDYLNIDINQLKAVGNSPTHSGQESLLPSNGDHKLRSQQTDLNDKLPSYTVKYLGVVEGYLGILSRKMAMKNEEGFKVPSQLYTNMNDLQKEVSRYNRRYSPQLLTPVELSLPQPIPAVNDQKTKRYQFQFNQGQRKSAQDKAVGSSDSGEKHKAKSNGPINGNVHKIVPPPFTSGGSSHGGEVQSLLDDVSQSNMDFASSTAKTPFNQNQQRQSASTSDIGDFKSRQVLSQIHIELPKHQRNLQLSNLSSGEGNFEKSSGSYIQNSKYAIQGKKFSLVSRSSEFSSPLNNSPKYKLDPRFMRVPFKPENRAALLTKQLVKQSKNLQSSHNAIPPFPFQGHLGFQKSDVNSKFIKQSQTQKDSPVKLSNNKKHLNMSYSGLENNLTLNRSSFQKNNLSSSDARHLQTGADLIQVNDSFIKQHFHPKVIVTQQNTSNNVYYQMYGSSNPNLSEENPLQTGYPDPEQYNRYFVTSYSLPRGLKTVKQITKKNEEFLKKKFKIYQQFYQNQQEVMEREGGGSGEGEVFNSQSLTRDEEEQEQKNKEEREDQQLLQSEDAIQPQPQYVGLLQNDKIRQSTQNLINQKKGGHHRSLYKFQNDPAKYPVRLDEWRKQIEKERLELQFVSNQLAYQRRGFQGQKLKKIYKQSPNCSFVGTDPNQLIIESDSPINKLASSAMTPLVPLSPKTQAKVDLLNVTGAENQYLKEGIQINHANMDLIRKKGAQSAFRITEKRNTNMNDSTGLQGGIDSQDATKRFNQTQMILRANQNMGLDSDSQIINIQTTDNNQTDKSRLLNQNSDRDSATDSQPLILEDKLNFSTRIQKLNYHIDVLNQEVQGNKDMGKNEISQEKLSVQQNAKPEENNPRQLSETKVIKSHIHKQNKSVRNSGLVISESIKIPSRAQNLAPDVGLVQMENLQVQGQVNQNQQQNIKDIPQKAQSSTDINQYLQQNNKNALRNSLIPQITTDLQFQIQKNSISSMTAGIGLESVSQSPIGSVKTPFPFQHPSPNPFLPKMNRPQLVHHQTQFMKDQEIPVDDTMRYQRMGIEQLKFDKFYSANIMSEKEIPQGRNLGIINKDSILNQSDGGSRLSPKQKDSSNMLQSQNESTNSAAQKARYKKSLLYNGNNLPLSPSALKVQQGRVRRTHQQRMLLRDDPFSLQNVDNFLMGKQVYAQLHSEVQNENILPYSPSKGQRNQYKCHHQAHPRNHKSNLSANVSNFSSRKNSTLTDIELEQIAALKAAAHLGLVTSKSNLGNKDLKIPPPQQHRQVQISASMPVQYLDDPVYVNKSGDQPQNLISLSPLGPALLNGSIGQQPLQSEIHEIEHIHSITIPNEGVLDYQNKARDKDEGNLNLMPSPHDATTQNAAATPQFNQSKLKSISPSNSEIIPQYELQDLQVDMNRESQDAILEKNQATSFSAINPNSQFEQQLQHQQTLKNPKSPSADIFQAEKEAAAASKRASQVVGFSSDYLGSQTNMINSNSISQSNISPSKQDQTSQANINNEQASETKSLAVEKKPQPQKKKVSNSSLKHKSVLVTTTSQRYNFMSLSFANSQPNESSEGQVDNESGHRQDPNMAIQEEESESQVSASSLQKKVRTDQAYQASRKSVIVTSQSRGFKHHTTQNLQLHNGARASQFLDQISDQFEEEDEQASHSAYHTKQKGAKDKQESSMNPSEMLLENQGQELMQNVSSISSNDSDNEGEQQFSKRSSNQSSSSKQ